MSVKNLHSLINGRWFIHKPYGHSLLPSLFSILEGNGTSFTSEERVPDVFISSKKASQSLVSADSFNSEENQSEYVAVIQLKDPIYKYDQECGPRGTKSKMNSMRRFEQDPNCAGVVLDIDSGGGQVSGTPEFYDFIKAYSKPVVAYTDGYMCSAAYYIGSAASHIVANQRAEHIGSIGVMVHFIDVSGMYEKKGAKVITEYSTFSPDKNKSYEELLKGNPELYIKTELDPLANDFINDIKAVRPDVDAVVFGGGTWNATDALAKNLINEIGTFQSAVSMVFELSNSSNSNNNKSNSKKKTMSKKTKNFAAIQKKLGIEGNGIATIATVLGNKGVQLTEAQLEVLDTTLTENQTAIEAGQTRVSAIDSALDAALATAKLAVGADASIETKIAALGTEITRLGNVPGTKITKPKAEGDSFEEEDPIVNASDAHNELYNRA